MMDHSPKLPVLPFTPLNEPKTYRSGVTVAAILVSGPVSDGPAVSVASAMFLILFNKNLKIIKVLFFRPFQDLQFLQLILVFKFFQKNPR